MSTTKVLSKVPTSDVGGVMQAFLDAGCVAKKSQEKDGTWTVTATCPDVAPEQKTIDQ